MRIYKNCILTIFTISLSILLVGCERPSWIGSQKTQNATKAKDLPTSASSWSASGLPENAATALSGQSVSRMESASDTTDITKFEGGKWMVDEDDRTSARYEYATRDGTKNAFSYLSYISEDHAIALCDAEIKAIEGWFSCETEWDKISIRAFFELLNKMPDISNFPENPSSFGRQLHIGGLMEGEMAVKKYGSGYLVLGQSVQYAGIENVIFDYYELDTETNAIFHYNLMVDSIPDAKTIFEGRKLEDYDDYRGTMTKAFQTWKFDNPRLQKVFEDFMGNIANIRQISRDVGMEP